MLREIIKVAQDDPSRPKRWFTSAYFDLFVRYGPDHQIDSYELCYNKTIDEKVVSFSGSSGISHHTVDDGEQDPLRPKRAPIYLPDDRCDHRLLCTRFIQESKAIDQQVVNFVVDTLKAALEKP